MALLGSREPRLRVVPPYERTRGQDAIDVARMAGLHLDPWQEDVLMDLCAIDGRGRWSTLEGCVVVGRQNGKGAIIEALALASLFLWDDELITYSAHRFDTAQKMFARIQKLIEGCGQLSRRVRRIYEGNGKERVSLMSGAELVFMTRSDSAGRGFSSPRAFIDEAFKLDAPMMGAILPTMSAMPNPQVGYFSSAGWEISTQLGNLRRRALAAALFGLLEDGYELEAAAARLGVHIDDAKRLRARGDGRVDPSLAFLEWSVPELTPRTKSAMADRSLWAQANPAYGHRLSENFTAAELRSMSAIEFGRERLGIGDYPPDEEDDGWGVISEADWIRLVHPSDPRPGKTGPERPALSVDVKRDRTGATICAAFGDGGGSTVVEVVGHRQGTGWVVPRMVELVSEYQVCAVALDTVGPASSLIEPLKNAGVQVLELGMADIAEAYGQFYEAATDTKTLRHLDAEPLNDAVQEAQTRRLGDRQTWERTPGASPLIAATNALHAHIRTAHLEGDPMQNIW